MMTMRCGIKFLKMHGLGNDFIMVNKADISHIDDLSSLIKLQSHRQLGVGCDQFIIYEEKQELVEMFVYNTDGSKAEACGNAARCLTLLVCKKNNYNRLNLLVTGRLLECILHTDDTVSVNMGEAQFEKDWMPKSTSLWEIAERFKLNLREIICIDMGNPHLVIFNNSLTAADKRLLGELLEKHPMFYSGINVNIAEVSHSHNQQSVIFLKVWERGVGDFTLACGSGACATYAAARKLGLVGNETEIRFESGSLFMLTTNGIIMRGPATLVYEGLYYP